MVFSSNTQKKVRDEIEGCLGVHATDNLGMYRGIPSFWGKTRYKALEYVKHRIVGKLKGWKQQTLSYGGKEVLVKAVACAVPIYTLDTSFFSGHYGSSSPKIKEPIVERRNMA